jgi:hypothetical protein
VTSPEPARTVLVLAHTGREVAGRVASDFCTRLVDAGVGVRLLADEAPDLTEEACRDAELVAHRRARCTRL